MADYEIRPYEAGDAAGYLELYREVLEEFGSEAWFAWKYEGNPYVDDVPIVVAIEDGSVVGARSFFALRVAVGDERSVVLQPCDTMVHPDHRRRGLFRRMTEFAIDRYAGEYPFFFNFPNRLTLQGNLELGWRVVSERTTHYRFEDPARYAREQADRWHLRLAGRLAAPFVRAGYRVLDARYEPPDDVSVRRAEGVPAGELAARYRQSIPREVHAVRDEQFYGWRFGNPGWEYTVYLAATDRGPDVGAVAGRSTGPGAVTTRLVDLVPLADAPAAAVATLLERIIADHPETDLFVAPSTVVPGDVRRTFGFVPDSSPVLGPLASRTTHVVRSLTGEWRYGGVDLLDAGSWLLTFAEEDTA